MTRLELIAKIVREMHQELKEDNDRAAEKERLDDSDIRDFSFDPHIIQLTRDKQ
jgi:hypothetical protein